jgi:hypothetical protein
MKLDIKEFFPLILSLSKDEKGSSVSCSWFDGLTTSGVLFFLNVQEMKRTLGPALLILWLAPPLVLQGEETSQAPPGTAQTQSEGSVGEFVIKGETKLSVESEKPPLDLPADASPLFETPLKTEPELLTMAPPELRDLPKPGPGPGFSPFVIIPRFQEFRADAVAADLRPRAMLARVYQEADPKRAKKAAQWELRVVESGGRTYLRFDGKGLPPETLAVPTRGSSGETIRIGHPYAAVLAYRDSYGDLHTAYSEPFTVTGLIDRDAKGASVILALGRVFRGRQSPELSEKGRELLQETADWIKAHGAAAAPVSIEVVAAKTDLARDQAAQIAKFLAKALLREPATLAASGRAYAQGIEDAATLTVAGAASKPR